MNLQAPVWESFLVHLKLLTKRKSSFEPPGFVVYILKTSSSEVMLLGLAGLPLMRERFNGLYRVK